MNYNIDDTIIRRAEDVTFCRTDLLLLSAEVECHHFFTPVKNNEESDKI